VDPLLYCSGKGKRGPSSPLPFGSPPRTHHPPLTALQPFWFLFSHYHAAPQDYQDASKYLKSLTALLAEGKLQPVKHRLMAGGLGDNGKGFEEMRAGRVRGEKLVYPVRGRGGGWRGGAARKRGVREASLGVVLLAWIIARVRCNSSIETTYSNTFPT